MRFLAESRSRLLARAALLALMAAGAAGCSGDLGRFNDNPFSSPMAARPAAGPGEVTGSVPSGRVEAQPLPAPPQPATISSTGVSGGGGMASYHPPTAAPATRLAGASAPVRPAPVSGGGATHSQPKAAAPAGGIHVVAPGETLI
jgi:hypothetical protein